MEDGAEVGVYAAVGGVELAGDGVPGGGGGGFCDAEEFAEDGGVDADAGGVDGGAGGHGAEEVVVLAEVVVEGFCVEVFEVFELLWGEDGGV